MIIGGLLFLQRRSGGMGGGGGMNPMNMGKAKSKIQMEPETGVTFVDVAGCEGSKQERGHQRCQTRLQEGSTIRVRANDTRKLNCSSTVSSLLSTTTASSD